MNIFARHRQALMRRLPDGLILLCGGVEVERNREVNFTFRQDSNFLYLTGIEEPNCRLLMDPKKRASVLFLPRIDHIHRIWNGDVPGPKQAKKLYGFSETAYSDTLPQILRKARKSYGKIYTDKSQELQDALDELRAVKDPGELRLMQEAARISSRAHRLVMALTRPGLFEYQVQAIFESECMKAGLKHLAYPSIVATGSNAAVLHYCRNSARLKPGELLLIDAGAELKGYAADITRTFPVSARFTQRQKDIYSIVLETQKAVMDRARPGVNWSDIHMFSMTKIAEGLKSLGLLQGNASGLVEGGAVRLFYPHGIGHMLGLDVHDGKGGSKRHLPNPYRVRFSARLEPGFVVTVEPGIYFNKAPLTDPSLRGKYKGSIHFAKVDRFLDFGGVRIEDDIVIATQGPPRLLTSVPREISEVEECRRP